MESELNKTRTAEYAEAVLSKHDVRADWSCPAQEIVLKVRIANGFITRLVGWLGVREPSRADFECILFPRCRAVHTLGMAFDLDLIWLSQEGQVVAITRSAQPNRFFSCRSAAMILELPADHPAGELFTKNLQLEIKDDRITTRQYF